MTRTPAASASRRALALLLLCAPRAALADEPPPPEPPPAAPPPAAPERRPLPPPPPPFVSSEAAPARAKQWGLGFQMGVRTTWADSPGLHPFSSSDVTPLPGFFLGSSLRVWRSGPASAWALAGWTTGGTQAMTRGVPASFNYHLLQAGIEGHYALLPFLDALVRVAPSAVNLRGKFSPYSGSHESAATPWTWGLDATAGAALMLGAVGDSAWPSARFWLQGELGYAYTAPAPMSLEARVDDEEKPRHGSVNLPDLSLSGVLLRISVGLTM